ncbi:hypothetical protein TNCV_1046441 [Trichonephila clavipes]|nr:hypothetical protein TNCV_1046441 [Trichonephila clavipes]
MGQYALNLLRLKHTPYGVLWNLQERVLAQVSLDHCVKSRDTCSTPVALLSDVNINLATLGIPRWHGLVILRGGA